MDEMNKKIRCIRGFTLVELIVVLVILAILAAFTIPAMLGFVEDAKSKASITLAREVYTAAQSAATEMFTRMSGNNLEDGNAANINRFKEDIGKKILMLTAGDLNFKKVVTGDGGNTPANAKSDFIEVAIRYSEGGSYNPSEFKYPNSAKIWFDRKAADSNQFVVKAIWYVNKEGTYRIIIMEDETKGIATTVEKIKN